MKEAHRGSIRRTLSNLPTKTMHAMPASKGSSSVAMSIVKSGATGLPHASRASDFAVRYPGAIFKGEPNAIHVLSNEGISLSCSFASSANAKVSQSVAGASARVNRVFLAIAEPVTGIALICWKIALFSHALFSRRKSGGATQISGGILRTNGCKTIPQPLESMELPCETGAVLTISKEK